MHLRSARRLILPVLFALAMIADFAALSAFSQVAVNQETNVARPSAAVADSSSEFPAVLCGAAYYHEYEPYERLDQDIAMMKAAGLNVVRMGESTWSLWEPEDGHFEYAWMDHVVDAMSKAGIKVLMGTPTYSIPAWLLHEHPVALCPSKGGIECP